MAIEKWLAITSVGLFAMFAGEMISVYNFMNTVPEDAVVAQGFSPDPKFDINSANRTNGYVRKIRN